MHLPTCQQHTHSDSHVLVQSGERGDNCDCIHSQKRIPNTIRIHLIIAYSHGRWGSNGCPRRRSGPGAVDVAVSGVSACACPARRAVRCVSPAQLAWTTAGVDCRLTGGLCHAIDLQQASTLHNRASTEPHTSGMRDATACIDQHVNLCLAVRACLRSIG